MHIGFGSLGFSFLKWILGSLMDDLPDCTVWYCYCSVMPKTCSWNLWLVVSPFGFNPWVLRSSHAVAGVSFMSISAVCFISWAKPCAVCILGKKAHRFVVVGEIFSDLNCFFWLVQFLLQTGVQFCISSLFGSKWCLIHSIC